MAPVAQGVDVAHEQAFFEPLADVGQAACDLACDKGLTTPGALMVEENAVAGVDAVGFAVVDRDPVGVHLGYGIGAARVERRCFLLRRLLHQTVEFTGTGLVKAGLLLHLQDADRLQDAKGSHRIHIGCVFRTLEANRHVRLGTEVVDLVGLGFLDDTNQVAGVRQVAVVQPEIGVCYVRVLVDVVDTLGVEGTGAALDAVHEVAFFQQQLRQVTSVLAGDAGDEGDFLSAHAYCLKKSW